MKKSKIRKISNLELAIEKSNKEKIKVQKEIDKQLKIAMLQNKHQNHLGKNHVQRFINFSNQFQIKNILKQNKIYVIENLLHNLPKSAHFDTIQEIKNEKEFLEQEQKSNLENRINITLKSIEQEAEKQNPQLARYREYLKQKKVQLQEKQKQILLMEQQKQLEEEKKLKNNQIEQKLFDNNQIIDQKMQQAEDQIMIQIEPNLLVDKNQEQQNSTERRMRYNLELHKLQSLDQEKQEKVIFKLKQLQKLQDLSHHYIVHKYGNDFVKKKILQNYIKQEKEQRLKLKESLNFTLQQKKPILLNDIDVEKLKKGYNQEMVFFDKDLKQYKQRKLLERYKIFGAKLFNSQDEISMFKKSLKQEIIKKRINPLSKQNQNIQIKIKNQIANRAQSLVESRKMKRDQMQKLIDEDKLYLESGEEKFNFLERHAKKFKTSLIRKLKLLPQRISQQPLKQLQNIKYRYQSAFDYQKANKHNQTLSFNKQYYELDKQIKKNLLFRKVYQKTAEKEEKIKNKQLNKIEHKVDSIIQTNDDIRFNLYFQ